MMKKMNTSKHIPLRTCIACRQQKDKWQLVRLVRSASGAILVDTSGRQPGRGAYLCRLPQCWQNGLAGGRLEHALRTSVNPENREQLAEYASTLKGGC
jgi:predicted RNA-binding protein YlxR (DUF448 family)